MGRKRWVSGGKLPRRAPIVYRPCCSTPFALFLSLRIVQLAPEWPGKQQPIHITPTRLAVVLLRLWDDMPEMRTVETPTTPSQLIRELNSEFKSRNTLELRQNHIVSQVLADGRQNECHIGNQRRWRHRRATASVQTNNSSSLSVKEAVKKVTQNELREYFWRQTNSPKVASS